MQILIRDDRRQGLHAVLIFGLGMIGRAIRDALLRSQYLVKHELRFDWQDRANRRRQREEIRKACTALVPSASRLSLLWSAGRANFFSSEEETARENNCFDEVIALAKSLGQMPRPAALEIHLISSAGGLFEEQKFVTSASQPRPRRPYGRMKLAQERRLRDSMEPGEIAIYRPSSVYGPMRQPRRHGLINKLISDATSRRVTVLDANVMALRDYVYSEDIGSYVARQIRVGLGERRTEPVHFLVSARCASIFEVVSKIERIMNRPVRYRYDKRFGNSANITFADSTKPVGWRPSTFDMGIRQFILRDMPQTRPISRTDPQSSGIA